MTDLPPLPPFLLLETVYRDYIWGGNRLRPGHSPTAEAWVVFEQNKVAGGCCQGQTLAELISQHGAALLGQRAFQRTPERFPLLIKLLDCAEWLSIQVHPDDEQAAQLEGPEFFGKTEAWHVLQANPGAQVIAGIRPGVSQPALEQAIWDGTIELMTQYLPIHTGDTIFMPPGTLHALGPGLLIYEVQQTSDLTYRVYDWGRPASDKRPLHIKQSLAVTRHDAQASPTPLLPVQDASEQVLSTCPYFTLSHLAAAAKPIVLDTHAESFHALTMIEGQARLKAGGESLELAPFDTVLVPAASGSYQLEPLGAFRALKSSV
jgi:mannose-6-phosphate isomerase